MCIRLLIRESSLQEVLLVFEGVLQVCRSGGRPAIMCVE